MVLYYFYPDACHVFYSSTTHNNESDVHPYLGCVASLRPENPTKNSSLQSGQWTRAPCKKIQRRNSRRPEYFTKLTKPSFSSLHLRNFSIDVRIIGRQTALICYNLVVRRRSTATLRTGSEADNPYCFSYFSGYTFLNLSK